MALSKKSMQELEKLISEMSKEQFLALKEDIDKQAHPQMTLGQLIEARDEINAIITSATEAQRLKLHDELKAKWDAMKAEAAQLGLNLENELGITPPIKRVRIGNGAAGVGKIAVPKYVNPDNTSETYTGRGKRIRWLAIEMAKMGLDEKADIPAKFHNPEYK